MKSQPMGRWGNDSLSIQSLNFINDLPVKDCEKLIEQIANEITSYRSFKKSADSIGQVVEQMKHLKGLSKQCLRLRAEINEIHRIVKANAFSDLKRKGISFNELENKMGEDLKSMSVALDVMSQNLEPNKDNVGRKSNQREHGLLTDICDYIFESMDKPITKTKATKIALQILRDNQIQVPTETDKAMEAIRQIRKLRNTPK